MEITAGHLNLIAFVGCFPFSIFALSIALFSRITRGKHVDWQPVQGIIVFSGVSKYFGRKTTPFDYILYTQTIEYSYLVNGKEYVNNIFRRGENTRAVYTQERAKETHLQFKVGSPINVYIDPQDPTNSVLDPIDPNPHITATILGLMSAAIGGVLWILSIYVNLP